MDVRANKGIKSAPCAHVLKRPDYFYVIDFLRELSKFIADGRLHCKIDKVRGIVITTRPDSKNAQYQATIKQGDILINRVQKLSRVINI